MNDYLVIVYCRDKDWRLLAPQQFRVRAKSAGKAVDLATAKLHKAGYETLKAEMMLFNQMTLEEVQVEDQTTRATSPGVGDPKKDGGVAQKTVRRGR